MIGDVSKGEVAVQELMNEFPCAIETSDPEGNLRIINMLDDFEQLINDSDKLIFQLHINALVASQVAGLNGMLGRDSAQVHIDAISRTVRTTRTSLHRQMKSAHESFKPAKRWSYSRQ